MTEISLGSAGQLSSKADIVGTTGIIEEEPLGITLTEKARKKTLELASDPAHREYNYLRVYLSGKGCDGFTYGVQFHHKNDGDVEFRSNTDTGSNTGTTIKEESRDIPLICDKDSLEFLRGSVIDYVDDDRGKGFLVDNPRHRKYRGKFYKRKVWQDKLQQKKASPS
ncbi:MAG: iron-sulfur cluster assembly accessory protein [Proteobacteria bacterium]|nr:iron-sulfur cluster assembly accessory protein [Pseudomonadota bacterium]